MYWIIESWLARPSWSTLPWSMSPNAVGGACVKMHCRRLKVYEVIPVSLRNFGTRTDECGGWDLRSNAPALVLMKIACHLSWLLCIHHFLVVMRGGLMTVAKEKTTSAKTWLRWYTEVRTSKSPHQIYLKMQSPKNFSILQEELERFFCRLWLGWTRTEPEPNLH